MREIKIDDNEEVLLAEAIDAYVTVLRKTLEKGMPVELLSARVELTKKLRQLRNKIAPTIPFGHRE